LGVILGLVNEPVDVLLLLTDCYLQFVKFHLGLTDELSFVVFQVTLLVTVGIAYLAALGTFGTVAVVIVFTACFAWVRFVAWNAIAARWV
jgi:hypothetical protein